MGLVATLLHTAAARPYVVAFLATFLVLGVLNRGAARTLLLLLFGYGIAFVSEFASIRWGFPYGHYEYLYDAMPGELIVAGVPAWDSVSYAFLAYAAYETASWLGWRRRVLGGAFLMVWADVVIDPLALRGEQWFLGQVFHYTIDGAYFGVPLANFAGWFVVGLSILWSWDRACARWFGEPPPLRAQGLGVAFYYGIVGFIAAVGLWIGAYAIVSASLLLHSPILVAVGRRLSRAAPPDRGTA